jgi:hypothetical protein
MFDVRCTTANVGKDEEWYAVQECDANEVEKRNSVGFKINKT